NGKRETGNGFIEMELILSQFNARDIAACTGGTLAAGPGNAVFSGVSIDSRTLRSGDLFFAIRGPRLDGHNFIPDALSGGAAGIVAESGYRRPDGFPGDRVLIQVQDTHRALKDFAAAARRRWNGILVGITGSMGKTTAKEFMAQMMERDCGVYRSPGNYNNLYGLPLAVFGLKTGDSIGIFEMGMSEPGEIAKMCRIAAPVMGVITNVAPVHLEFFGSLEEIARAKGELAEALPANGTLIYNSDIALVRDIASRFGGRKTSFGFNDGAEFRADRIEIVARDETRFRLSYGGTESSAAIPLPGAHFVKNALPAVALARHCGLAPERIAENLRRLRQASMRGRILSFKAGFTVIDDSYNSNPEALKSMVEVLSRLPSFQRRILVAGEMLELGPEAESLHRECGVFAAKSGIDIILGVRGAAREIVRASLALRMKDIRAHYFENTDEASLFLNGELRRGDLVLVKGSRGVRMETLIENLRSHFEQTGPF
ncbi:MAG: UDP-N-acetylmuramoyl-tripeptide--D-alanyl-D-alanine ligase, partial [Acidobacteria bacterium]|nr:UDP-N-acetylmuramoyl-tripeptide--D-alanyl-D-alanine ligase [Acidobacteriota bacterium]